MKQFQKNFDNAFDEVAITNPRMVYGMADCISRFSNANDQNQFNSVLSELTNTHNALRDSLNTDETALLLRMGSTDIRDNIWLNFKQATDRREGRLKDLWGEGSPRYIEFLPRGRGELNHARVDERLALVKRWSDAATKYAVELGADFVAEFNTFYTQYNNAQQQQLSHSGQVGGAKPDKLVARQQANTALMVALWTAAAYYKGNLPQCMALFDPNRFVPQAGGSSDETPPAVPPVG